MSLMLIKYDPKNGKNWFRNGKKNLFQNQKINSETRFNWYVCFDFNLLKIRVHMKKD